MIIALMGICLKCPNAVVSFPSTIKENKTWGRAWSCGVGGSSFIGYEDSKELRRYSYDMELPPTCTMSLEQVIGNEEYQELRAINLTD